MATSEIVVNEYLTAELRTLYPAWASAEVISCENTGTLLGSSNARPDIVIQDNPIAPVSIETEFFPANTVEADASARLGKVFVPSGGKIGAALAVRYPSKYKSLVGSAITNELKTETELEYCLLSGDPANPDRWPTVGYVQGSVADLAYVVATARVSQAMVEQGATILEDGAKTLAAMLSVEAKHTPKVASAISECLKQEASLQTYAMAATIIVNAMVFQETISGTSSELADVKGLYELSEAGEPTKNDVIGEWNAILAINYWPIFGIARALVIAVPSSIWSDFWHCSMEVADKLLSLKLGKNPDLVGTIFQRLISDRRFLATFYTAPSSAALMSKLMIGQSPPHGGSWDDAEAVTSLKLADFACGTGSLLCALYSEVRNAVENAGIDSELLHRRMIENSLFGCDVIPSATHITATQLSSAFPTVQYTDTKILTMPFGRMPDKSVALGAIDLLDTQAVMPTISTHAQSVGAHSGTELDAWAALGGTFVYDQSFDLIAMNPPFTRLTGGGGKSAEVSRPLFAAFGTTEADQALMAKKASRLFQGTAYQGNAGAGSAFAEIAHRKIKDGGTIGLILLSTALSGQSWEDCRSLWRRHYRDIITLTIASSEPGCSAFSADTGIAECMIIATRTELPDNRVLSVSLYRRPISPLEGAEIARVIKKLRDNGAANTLDGGVTGGTAIHIGDEKVGEAVLAPLSAGPWPLARIYDHALAQAAFQLVTLGRIWLPGWLGPVTSPTCFVPLKSLGKVGPYHLDVSASALSGGAPRGPFDVKPTSQPASVTFPVMAAHNEKKERFLELQPDAEGRPRTVTASAQAIQNKRLETIWGSRAKLHFATDTRFNANALIACCTTRDAVGGRAWPSFGLSDRRFEKAAALWFNSSLGILAFWWLASKTQDGRGSVTTTRLQDLVCPDFRQWSAADLKEADDFFEAFKTKPLLDIHECAIDPHRSELDHFIVRHFLKTAEQDLQEADNGMQLLRAKLSLEPSINGGKH